MQVLVNGKREELESGVPVGSLLQKLGYTSGFLAVVIDGKHIPRSSWDQRKLADGECLEIVAPMQGG